LELARKLKKKDQSLGVILSSGYSDKKVSKDTIKDEAYKFIQKPYNILKLLKTIKKSINGNT
jgi:FixJ family two-component response regulator